MYTYYSPDKRAIVRLAARKHSGAENSPYKSLLKQVKRSSRILCAGNDRQVNMASLTIAPAWSLFTIKRNSIQHRNSGSCSRQRQAIRAMGVEKPLEELYNIKVERNVSKQQLAELGVSKWSIWKTGKCRLPWDWHVDQLVYIEEGEVRVVPEGSQRYMRFAAGDLVRYPKWFEADLWFNDFYQERYRFRAYGDD